MERLIRRLAEASDTTPARAADQLDQFVSKILKDLRDGKTARIPGLGDFAPGPRPEFHNVPVSNDANIKTQEPANARNRGTARGRR